MTRGVLLLELAKDRIIYCDIPKDSLLTLNPVLG